MATAHTIFQYQYRDASNYKVSKDVLLFGCMAFNANAEIEAALNSDGFFVPELVGLKPLQSELPSFPSVDDHIWHEYICLRPATDCELNLMVAWGTLTALVGNFISLPPWSSAEMAKQIGSLFQAEPYCRFA